jgi:molybdate transport system substrate-binding protein
MRATRRQLMTALPLLVTAPAVQAAAPAAGGPAPGPTSAGTTDLALTCDLAAGPAIALAVRAFRAQAGVRVRVFPTPPSLIVPQLQRQIQNDIVLTQPRWLDQAEKDGLIAPGGRTPAWRNPVVIATGAGGPADSFALPDPIPGSDFNGPGILMRMRLTPQRIYGVIDTETVLALLLDTTARQGLLHQTEMVAHPELTLAQRVPDSATPPILYAATVTRLARRPDPQAFVQFLNTPECQTILHAAGLESAA